MTLANGKIYFARANGNLYSIDFANGSPVGGTELLVSSASDGCNWASNGLFVFTHVTAGSAIFSDDFSTGAFSKWTGVTQPHDRQLHGRGRATERARTDERPERLRLQEPGRHHPSICMSANVNAATLDPSATTLFRLRTAANGPIAKVFINANGVLYVRSDASNTQHLLGRRARQRMARDRAVRDGRGVEHVGPVPGRRQGRERLDRQHRHDAGRQGGHRQRAGLHGDDQLRRHRRRPDAGLRS